MSWVAQLPGMRSGHRARNVALGIGYALVVFPIVLALLPLLAAGAVASNYRDAATHLAELPGVESGGGLRAGVVAGLYVFVFWSLALTSGAMIGDYVAAPGGDETHQPASTDDRTDEEQRSEEELLLFYETNVKQWGVDVQSVERSDDALVVEYRANTTREEAFTEEMAYLIGTYVDVVEAGLGTERMEVTAVDPDDGSDHAYWHVETEWAAAYLDGDLTEEEVFNRVIETIEAA